MTKPKDHCPSCQMPWVDHPGVAGTCKNLERARSALKIIHTWATFDDGSMLTPELAAKLCARVLKETAP